MRRRSTVVLMALSLAAAVAAEPVPHEGAATYERYCAGCHGDRGDGQGPAAAMLITKPRDFSKGIFKFRSTANGSLPTDADLMRTITNGVYRTSMPEWSLLPERERVALVAYLKTFYPQWKERGPGTPIAMPPVPADLASAERVKRGRELYEGLECSTCHGMTGRGDGPSAAQLPLDEWGNPQKPFDFSKGRLKSGAAPEDVYRTFMTGLNGTAMPSFGEVFADPDGENIKEGDGWSLVAYVLSLRTPAQPAGKDVQP